MSDTHIGLERANIIIAAAFSKGREMGLKPLSCVVTDAGGHVIAFQRQDGTSFLRLDIAVGKAAGALALGVNSRRIGEMEQINVAAKSYLDRHGRPRSLADLAGHLAVNYFSSRTGRDLAWEYVEDGELKTFKMRSAVSVASSDAYLACCRAGLGLIQVPRNGIEDLLTSGELEEVLPAYRPEPLPVSVVYSHNRQMTPRVRVFVDWVAGVLAS